MPYEFFFSYTRATNDSYLQRFFDDLDKAVRDKRGLPGGHCGFFDQKDLVHGDEWPARLLHALQTSKTFVALYSPAYFNSEACGQEWRIFQMRRQLYADQRHVEGQPPPPMPPLLKPILWIPLRESPEGEVAAVQYTRGDPALVQNTKGLQYVRKQISHYGFEYNELIDQLAQEIVDDGDRYPLPPLDHVPEFGKADASFPRVRTVGQGAPDGPSESGPASVRFVFVAGRPDQFGAGRRTATDAYREVGGRDWKPFFPERRRAIGPLAQSVAAAEDLNLFSEELPFDNQLPQKIRAAETERRLVVVFADMFSIDLPAFRNTLREFDKQNYENCTVLVPQANHDPDSEPLGASAARALSQILYFRTRQGNRIYYRDAIASEDDLCAQLRDVLTLLRAEIINKTKPVAPVPVGGSKPMVNGPGSSGNPPTTPRTGP